MSMDLMPDWAMQTMLEKQEENIKLLTEALDHTTESLKILTEGFKLHQATIKDIQDTLRQYRIQNYDKFPAKK